MLEYPYLRDEYDWLSVTSAIIHSIDDVVVGASKDQQCTRAYFSFILIGMCKFNLVENGDLDNVRVGSKFIPVDAETGSDVFLQTVVKAGWLELKILIVQNLRSKKTSDSHDACCFLAIDKSVATDG